MSRAITKKPAKVMRENGVQPLLFVGKYLPLFFILYYSLPEPRCDYFLRSIRVTLAVGGKASENLTLNTTMQ